MAIGRLDEKYEGLLLLTTDGKLSEEIRSSDYEKEYYCELAGEITEAAIEQMRMGMEISIEGKKYQTKPCKVERIKYPQIPTSGNKVRHAGHGPTSWVSITLTEGKFRQVRKMTAGVGFPTVRLIRVRIGNYLLEDMQPGEVKALSD